LAIVHAGREAQAADHPGPEVRDDVAVEVRTAEDVVLARSEDQLHAHVGDDAVLRLDVGVTGGDLSGNRQEEAVGVLHDVGLVDQRDLLASVLAGVVERELDDLLGPRNRYRLDGEAAVGPYPLP